MSVLNLPDKTCAANHDVRVVCAALTGQRFRFSSERDLQDGIEQTLNRLSIPNKREARLTNEERVDFLVGRVAVEVKTKGNRVSVMRQLSRYAECPDVDAIVLVTAKQTLGCPSSIGGKPITVVRIWSGAL